MSADLFLVVMQSGHGDGDEVGGYVNCNGRSVASHVR